MSLTSFLRCSLLLTSIKQDFSHAILLCLCNSVFLWKIYLCSFIPNCTQNPVIAYTYIIAVKCCLCDVYKKSINMNCGRENWKKRDHCKQRLKNLKIIISHTSHEKGIHRQREKQEKSTDFYCISTLYFINTTIWTHTLYFNTFIQFTNPW